jgi:hypothetical protein
MEKAIGFDWSAAQRLLVRVDNVSRSARQLWRPPPPTEEQDPTDDSADHPSWVQRRRQRKLNQRARQALREQRPHLEHAYNLSTSIFSAVNLETRNRMGTAKAGGAVDRTPSPEFLSRLESISPQVDDAERAFRRAAQRHAQVKYGKGMLVGVGLLGVICAALGLVFAAEDVPAWYGIALVGGGLGAVVSVLQRMASRRLRLDPDAGDGMLLSLGAVRPIVGAIFGMALFALLDGGWLPSVEIAPENRTSFYAGLGFLAGFNERFAQDMLVGSTRQLSSQAEPDDRPDER